MKINITANNIEVTEPLKAHIEERIHSLDKFLSKHDPDNVQTWVVVARTTNHHKHGDVYQAEINLRVGGDAFMAKAEGSDMRAVIDEVKDKVKAELIQHKDKNLRHSE
ncbi:MAG: ribosomal subunit interface protein [Candidatus Colwellbacteria bacterium RIFCSPLOWO2_01_FULL_48_10]|uniref:Ribosomal subunit interface protein n=2 Tax=Bacteria candidate phyla TaxID=1783234 RepID=A0A1F5NYJ9_9BACT|nr:MAG: ribosomal subunit interface protein [Candidatus Doudnabacteria bacterium RIFCSPHIGHO2_01_FULL_49_9]OGY59676.1 MAG: ribosomal subunit interface protein [Candidatus Colwellbacteria bacterium RIFCSPLOWO2_01_FULL_48_10]